MSGDQLRKAIIKLKRAERLNKIGSSSLEEELKKQEQVDYQVEQEYERRKKEAAKQLQEGMKLLKNQ